MFKAVVFLKRVLPRRSGGHVRPSCWQRLLWAVQTRSVFHRPLARRSQLQAVSWRLSGLVVNYF